MSVQGAVKRVQQRLQGLQRELGHTARLVAVSKKKPKEAVLAAMEAGQTHFGENYVQELVDKAAQCPRDVQWHFIGHLQSNKVRSVLEVPNLFLVESVDRIKLANKLNTIAAELRSEPLGVLVQVNTSGETSKSGVEPADCTALAQHIVTQCPHLLFRGLMTIGRPSNEPDPTCFQTLVQCRREVADSLGVPEHSLELSMGMSNDYELAIRTGSTNVRVGSTIFGARE